MTAGGAAIPIISGYRDWSTLVSYLDFTYGPPALDDYTLKMRYWAPGAATRQVYRRIPGSASTATITSLPSSTASWSTQSVVLTAWQPLPSPSLNVSLSANTTSDGRIALDYVDICPPASVATPTPTPTPSPTPTATCTKLGDTNCDTKVNTIDLQAVLSNYGKRTTLRSQGDLTGDGLIDFSDYLEFLSHYDAGC